MSNDGGVPAVNGGPSRRSESRQILGIDFFNGSATRAVERMRSGGLLVVPAAPALCTLPEDKAYREALMEADLAITDSAFMVLVWNLLEGDSVGRLSGLQYFNHLIKDPEFHGEGTTLYVMASDESARKNLSWLRQQGVSIRPDQIYIAPLYGNEVNDTQLLERVAALRPRHVVITIGGGIQERLGLYIKRSVDYRPSIHCIGAAIAFRSGDQVYIPDLADRLGMGWLMRCLWRPRSYFPRYWAARRLAWLLVRYRQELPPLRAPKPTAARESSTSIA
jgi:UDP-N-acetyl-D-mannosaminuronic acid transferase (WecB/TagA/CpsF family)